MYLEKVKTTNLGGNIKYPRIYKMEKLRNLQNGKIQEFTKKRKAIGSAITRR
jgi:hypothetical protein